MNDDGIDVDEVQIGTNIPSATTLRLYANSVPEKMRGPFAFEATGYVMFPSSASTSIPFHSTDGFLKSSIVDHIQSENLSNYL
jgi:hypothetical protein